jgi:hypothetical protein
MVHKVAPNVHFGHELANRKFWVTKLPRASSLVIPSRPLLVFCPGTLFFLNATLKSCFFFVFCPFYLRHFIGVVQHRKRRPRVTAAGTVCAGGSVVGHLWPTPPRICVSTWVPPCVAKEDLASRPDQIHAATGAPPLTSSWDEGHVSHGHRGAWGGIGPHWRAESGQMTFGCRTKDPFSTSDVLSLLNCTRVWH